MEVLVLQFLDQCHVVATPERNCVWKNVDMGLGNASQPLMQPMQHNGPVHIIHVCSYAHE